MFTQIVVPTGGRIDTNPSLQTLAPFIQNVGKQACKTCREEIPQHLWFVNCVGCQADMRKRAQKVKECKEVERANLIRTLRSEISRVQKSEGTMKIFQLQETLEDFLESCLPMEYPSDDQEHSPTQWRCLSGNLVSTISFMGRSWIVMWSVLRIRILLRWRSLPESQASPNGFNVPESYMPDSSNCQAPFSTLASSDLNGSNYSFLDLICPRIEPDTVVSGRLFSVRTLDGRISRFGLVPRHVGCRYDKDKFAALAQLDEARRDSLLGGFIPFMGSIDSALLTHAIGRL
ncbi:hypothetical protein K438DRAFT_1752712 [Mycena galopus ATCC 62051]|nr:hypothetical protein K438DRAFT_1752712 [Mycena galopus ATCC 62051]